jgi:hypothetical protein
MCPNQQILKHHQENEQHGRCQRNDFYTPSLKIFIPQYTAAKIRRKKSGEKIKSISFVSTNPPLLKCSPQRGQHEQALKPSPHSMV